MTDNTFAPAAEAAVEGTSRSTLLIAGGLVGALVLGGGGYLLLSGGSDDDLGAGAPVVTRTKPAPKSATPAKRATASTASKPGLLPATTTVRIGRDPFLALYVMPAAGAAESVGAPSTGTTTVGGTTSGSSGTATTSTTYPMVLKRVYGSGSERTAEFSVDGKTMLAKVGSVFGKTSELKLLSLSQNSKGTWLGTVQVGDSDPFDAVQGQKVYVA